MIELAQIALRLLLCFMFLLIISCVKHSSELAACSTVCKQRYEVCSHVCKDNCQDCSVAKSCSTKRIYDKYVKETYVRGGILFRELNSFRDPLQCRKTTCHCFADYNVCIQSCKGHVYKQLRIPKSCC